MKFREQGLECKDAQVVSMVKQTMQAFVCFKRFDDFKQQVFSVPLGYLLAFNMTCYTIPLDLTMITMDFQRYKLCLQ